MHRALRPSPYPPEHPRLLLPCHLHHHIDLTSRWRQAIWQRAPWRPPAVCGTEFGFQHTPPGITSQVSGGAARSGVGWSALTSLGMNVPALVATAELLAFGPIPRRVREALVSTSHVAGLRALARHADPAGIARDLTDALEQDVSVADVEVWQSLAAKAILVPLPHGDRPERFPDADRLRAAPVAPASSEADGHTPAPGPKTSGPSARPSMLNPPRPEGKPR